MRNLFRGACHSNNPFRSSRCVYSAEQIFSVMINYAYNEAKRNKLSSTRSLDMYICSCARDYCSMSCNLSGACVPQPGFLHSVFI